MVMEIKLGDIVRLKKQHPCGSYEWQVVRLGADIGIGIAGVMGTSTVEDKPIGSVFISIDDRETIYRFVQNFPGQHIQIKQRAITSALFELRKILIYGGNHAPHY